MNLIISLIAIILLLIFILYTIKYIKRHYTPNEKEYYYTNTSPYDYTNTYTHFPFWNMQLGSKRGMSYDLRGDVPIPYYYQFPFNMSSRIPIRNKPLYLVS